MVVVVNRSPEWQAPNCSITDFLTIMGRFKFWWSDSNLFLVIGIQPLSERCLDHSYSLGDWPLDFPTMKHACNESGNDIIHAYLQLLSDTTPNIKLQLIQKLIKYRLSMHQASIGSYVASLETWGTISHKGRGMRNFHSPKFLEVQHTRHCGTTAWTFTRLSTPSYSSPRPASVTL